MNDNSLIKKLQGISFLHDIDPDHLEQIASIAESRVYDAQDILFHEGEPAEYVYLVVTGKIMLELCPVNDLSEESDERRTGRDAWLVVIC